MENTATYDTGSANPRSAEKAAREYLSFFGIATVGQAEQQRMLVLLDIEKQMSSANMGLMAAELA